MTKLLLLSAILSVLPPGPKDWPNDIIHVDISRKAAESAMIKISTNQRLSKFNEFGWILSIMEELVRHPKLHYAPMPLPFHDSYVDIRDGFHVVDSWSCPDSKGSAWMTPRFPDDPARDEASKWLLRAWVESIASGDIIPGPNPPSNPYRWVPASFAARDWAAWRLARHSPPQDVVLDPPPGRIRLSLSRWDAERILKALDSDVPITGEAARVVILGLSRGLSR